MQSARATRRRRERAASTRAQQAARGAQRQQASGDVQTPHWSTHLVCRGGAWRRCRSSGAAGARSAGKRYRCRAHARRLRREHASAAQHAVPAAAEHRPCAAHIVLRPKAGQEGVSARPLTCMAAPPRRWRRRRTAVGQASALLRLAAGRDSACARRVAAGARCTRPVACSRLLTSAGAARTQTQAYKSRPREPHSWCGEPEAVPHEALLASCERLWGVARHARRCAAAVSTKGRRRLR